MIHLTGPVLGDSMDSWVAWLSELRTLDGLDESVQFEIKIAEITLAEMGLPSGGKTN
jgi:hypothetical protein